MALLTGREYIESLKDFSPEVDIRGERVREVWSHPLLRQTVNHIAAGFDFARDPRYRNTSAVPSPLAGEEVPRLQLHIQESLQGSPEYTTEERLRVLNLAQDLAASRLTGTLMGFTINAAGSPVTNAIVVRNLYALQKRKQVAKEIAGIK
jgi:aromatic ring hydroxylase